MKMQRTEGDLYHSHSVIFRCSFIHPSAISIHVFIERVFEEEQLSLFGTITEFLVRELVLVPVHPRHRPPEDGSSLFQRHILRAVVAQLVELGKLGHDSVGDVVDQLLVFIP